MLTTADIAGMRATAEEALPDLCTIERKTVTGDGGGGTTETWAVRAAPVACRVAPTGGGETGTAGDRLRDETTHIATFPAGTDIEEADRIVVDAVRYEVTAVRKRGSWELSRRVELIESDDSSPLVTTLIWGAGLWDQGLWE